MKRDYYYKVNSNLFAACWMCHEFHRVFYDSPYHYEFESFYHLIDDVICNNCRQYARTKSKVYGGSIIDMGKIAQKIYHKGMHI